MKKKTTLANDMPSNLIDRIRDSINQYTGFKGRYGYYHDNYMEGKYEVHLHKFKRKGVLSRSKLQDICDHLKEEGFYGFQPTSEDAESYSGIVRYHKVKVK